MKLNIVKLPEDESGLAIMIRALGATDVILVMRIVFFLLFVCVVFFSSCTPKDPNYISGVEDSILEVDSLEQQGKIFKVDDVKEFQYLLNTDTAKEIFQNKIDRTIVFLPSEHENKLFVPSYGNALVNTLLECYNGHRPLVLSPDDIWLAISQGISIHINENIESLEKNIFVKNTPSEIELRDDALVYDFQRWEHLIGLLAQETKKYTKHDFYSLFISDFSTTTKFEKIAYEVTLLESYEQVFTYYATSICGIPSITLLGKKSDWESILFKLDQLERLGLGYWAKELRPVIKEFINIFDNKVNIVFWRNIFKFESTEVCSGPYITGWFIKLFPYIKDFEFVNENSKNSQEDFKIKTIYIKNPFIKGEKYSKSNLELKNIPSGLSDIRVNWKVIDATRIMYIYSGFFSIRQYSDGSLRPLVSWVLTDDSEFVEENDMDEEWKKEREQRDKEFIESLSNFK